MALTKIPKTLLDTSAGVNLGDNEKLLIGASDDLQIYHDGNNSYITDTGTGDLKIGGANIVITTAGGTKYFEGASNRAFLFHTGNQRLVTTATGILVTGNVAATHSLVQLLLPQVVLIPQQRHLLHSYNRN